MTPAQRAAVVAEAMTWRKTPFHHNARLKGVGVDCANLLVAAYAGAGLLPSLELGEYARNWHMHQDEPRFLEEIKRHCDPVPAGEEPLPGDIVMFSYGRHASHGVRTTPGEGAWLLLRCTATAVVLTVFLAQILERYTGLPAHTALAPIALAIGALGNGWRSIFAALSGALRALAGRIGGDR